MGKWAYRVLAGHTLTNGDVTLAPERKMAGVLLYLALEGPTARQKLAGLLWPDVDETRARNSLAQVIRRLRRATHPGIVTGDAILQLHGDLEVDAAAFELRMFRGDVAGALELAGELLPHYEFDDCPEYEAWLQSEREAFRNLTGRALAERIAALEQEGDIGTAVQLAERLIALDPVAEGPYRRLMRLHYLANDRAAALRIYRACRTALDRELGVEPDAETEALAKLVEQGRLQVPPRPKTGELPLEVRHPPVLIGRSREWARMEEGWARGHTVILHGPPGVGKTRLMTEFAASKGTFMVTEGRPGDAAVPYSSLARMFRRFFKAHPDVRVEPWIRREVSRFLPESSEPTAPPIASPQERLRFEEALFHLHQTIVSRYDTLLADDLQFYDAPSFETAARIVNRMPAEGMSAQTIAAFRTDEVPEEYLRNTRELAERDLLTLIELAPLDGGATADLVESLNLASVPRAASADLSASLHRYTGGNPLFILETLKYLIEGDAVQGGLPEQLPPGRVGVIIGQRLDRLSRPALRFAQAAAVLQADFDLELIAGMLEARPIDLVGLVEELEAASVLHGNRFGHDLVRVAVHESISPPFRMLLHARAAKVLGGSGAPAARVGGHWQAAGHSREAMQAWLEAGDQAETAFRLIEARSFFGRAAAIAQELGDDAVAFEALRRELLLIVRDDTSDAVLALLDRLASVAATVEQKAEVHELTAMARSTRGEAGEAEAAARAGLALIDGLDRSRLRASLLQRLATALWDLNRYDEALAALDDAMAVLASEGCAAQIAEIQQSISAVLNRAWRNREALAYQREAHATFRRLGDRYMSTILLMYIGVSQESLGMYPESLETYLDADASLREIPGTARFFYNNCVNLGYLHFGLEEYAKALDYLQDADRAERAVAHSRAIVARTFAQVHLALGQHAQFDAEIQEALARPDPGDPWRSLAKVVWAAELARRGCAEEARALFAKTERALAPETGAVPIVLAYLWLARAVSFTPEDGLRDIEKARSWIAERGIDVLHAELEVRHAQVLLEAGRASEALEHSCRAQERHAEIRLFGQAADLPFTHYRILRVLGGADAHVHLERAYEHVQRVADRHVPAAYREAFLTENPLNAAIVRAHREARS